MKAGIVTRIEGLTTEETITALKEILENKCVEQFKADKIYFLRTVRRKNDKGCDKEYGFIDLLKHEIKLPKDLINFFVFCVLDLKSKRLMINIELDDGSLKDVNNLLHS